MQLLPLAVLLEIKKRYILFFYFKGSGGLRARPGNAPLSTYSTGSVSNLPEQELSTQQRCPWKKGDSIVEPQGMYQLPNGKIFMGNECSET